jgi:hypothetical protein
VVGGSVSANAGSAADVPSEDIKTMRLRYAGVCAGCSQEVEKGERAHYLPATRTVRCLGCGPTPATDVPVVAGSSAAQEADRAAAQAARLAQRSDAAERRAAAFAAGAEGERIVAEALAPLSAAGYVLLHDRAAGPKANLDHVVIGPSGVWLVNAKHWSGTVVAGETLRHNGRTRRRQLERAVEERKLVEQLLRASGLTAPVHSVFAFTASAPDPATVDGVVMTPVGALRAVIGGAPPVLDPGGLDRVAACLVTSLPAAGAAEHPRAVADEELPEDLRDEGAYFFLEPWSRYGRKRLYLHRFGHCFGYVDTVERTCHVESDHDRAQPNLEFVLEWFADVDAEPRQLGRLGRLAMWVAGGASRRAVAVRFKRQRTDRLYVHLADGRSRHQIGYFDLLSGKAHAAEPEFAAVVKRAGELHATNSTGR